MTKTYSKNDVEFHSDGYGPHRPAVNVKVYGSIRDVKLPINLGGVSEIGSKEITWQYTESEFTVDWIEENVSEETFQTIYDLTREDGWEYLQQIAEEVFGLGVRVYSEGRSGGWAVVDGLSDFDFWDAIDLAKWRSFERQAKATADDVPHQTLVSIYINEFEPWFEEFSHRRKDATLVALGAGL